MSGNSKKTIAIITCLIISISIYCQNINHSFKAGQIWPDNDGKHINAHGGGIIYFNDTYYWFGEYRLEKRTRSSIWETGGSLIILLTAGISGCQ
jgi:hypothetical protein